MTIQSLNSWGPNIFGEKVMTWGKVIGTEAIQLAWFISIHTVDIIDNYFLHLGQRELMEHIFSG